MRYWRNSSGLEAKRNLSLSKRRTMWIRNGTQPAAALMKTKRFLGLRFGFIDAAAASVPFLIHIVRRLHKDKLRFASRPELFRQYRIYVACEADEDIPYLAKYTGDDHLDRKSTRLNSS